MSITSFYFLIFFTITLFVYYLVPGRLQWMVLLGASFVYYVESGDPALIVWPLVAVTVTWAGVRALAWLDAAMDVAAGSAAAGNAVAGNAVAGNAAAGSAVAGVDAAAGCDAADNADGGGRTSLAARILQRVPRESARRVLLWTEVVVLLGILIGFKYLTFFQNRSGGTSIAAPMGLSFYTFILLGYYIDVYNGIAPGQRGWGRTALMGMYFPLMTSGPITAYRDGEEPFFLPHRIHYDNLTYGAQRMLWGFYKELVISQRAGTLAATIFDNDTEYPGAYIWIGALAFTVQLYTNFSGCMDIVIGMSECLGVRLPENFRTPFLSKNISEYWRRWHATLGVWMKDHVFYPLLRTQLFIKQGKWLRKRLGKKPGKNVNTWLAMLVLWFTVGLWHGGALKYVIGCGLLHWFYIVSGEVTLPFWQKVCGALHLDLKSKGMDVFRVVRTFILVNIGNVFFNADSTGHAVRMLVEGVTTWNPGVLIDGSLMDLGLAWDDWFILAVSLVLLIVVSATQYRAEMRAAAEGVEPSTHVVRGRIAALPLPIRWTIWLGFTMLVILWGQYGPDFSAAEFIYEGF